MGLSPLFFFERVATFFDGLLGAENSFPGNFFQTVLPRNLTQNMLLPKEQIIEICNTIIKCKLFFLEKEVYCTRKWFAFFHGPAFARYNSFSFIIQVYFEVKKRKKIF